MRGAWDQLVMEMRRLRFELELIEEMGAAAHEDDLDSLRRQVEAVKEMVQDYASR